MSINIVSLSGNLTRDPELRATSSGTSILKFCIAVNDRRKVGDSWEDYPNYIDCAVYGKRADSLGNYLSKGIKVSVSGKLNQSRWEKDGRKLSKIEVVVDDLDFMSAKVESKQEILDVDIPF